MFGPDGKMYFGQGSATKSGVVGLNNGWVESHPFFHHHPGNHIVLNDQNLITENIQTESPDDYACTGAYSPFGVSNRPYEMVKGIIKASGSILRANINGSNLELVAWDL